MQIMVLFTLLIFTQHKFRQNNKMQIFLHLVPVTLLVTEYSKAMHIEENS